MILWEDLRFVLAAHRGGSLAAAARALGVDATTVGRRIAAAERALGTRLLLRGRDGLRATAAGLEAAATAARMAGAVEDLVREASGQDARLEGTVRVTSAEGIVALVLAPALPALRARHPGIAIELVATARALDLLRGEADLAVRLYRPREPGLVASRLGVLPYGLFAAPAYLAAAGTPRSPADLARHDLLGFDAALESTPEMRWLARHAPAAALRVRSTSAAVLVAACRAGAGIAALPERYAAGDPGLVRVLARADVPAREVWLAVHPGLRRAARVAAVTAWIREAFARRAPPGTPVDARSS